MTFDADKFLEEAENGTIAIDSHEKLLRIAYLRHCPHNIFESVEYLHKHGWSFGQGDLRFNLTLDSFYSAQIGYGDWLQGELEDDGRIYYPEQTDEYLADFGEHFTADIWKEYYSLDYLLHPSSARYWRPPNLRDLPSAGDPIGQLRQKPIGCHIRLPRWAFNVNSTLTRQTELPEDTMVQIALDTLRDVTARLREKYPQVPPYSETQARFWLRNIPRRRKSLPDGRPDNLSVLLAQGTYDIWDWQRFYTPERWHSSFSSPEALEEDLPGTTDPEVDATWPDCAPSGSYASERGWITELGSEEEVEFMAAVAAKETEGYDINALNYALRSHILLAILRLAFMPAESEEHREYSDKIRQGVLDKGRLNEASYDEWFNNVLKVMQPYAEEKKEFPVMEEDRRAFLRRILAENGQLFARGGWQFNSSSARMPKRCFMFDLEVAFDKRKKEEPESSKESI